jgi:hypothetical protein
MSVTSLATAARIKKAKQRRDDTVFTLSFRGGGTSQIVGYSSLAKELNIKESSITVLLSKGGDKGFTLNRVNPVTQETDILTVWRITPTKPKLKRGRPPKYIDKARLGTEFTGE